MRVRGLLLRLKDIIHIMLALLCDVIVRALRVAELDVDLFKVLRDYSI